MTPPTLPRRFYKTVDIAPVETGFAVRLDQATPKTPAKKPLVLPTQAAAELVAAEWDAQIESIDPFAMPITRLVNVALDRATETRHAMVGEIVKYAATDLVCYRAATPASLVAAQAAAWDPLLTWAEAHLGVQLVTTMQALAIDQPEESLARIEAAAHALDDLRLTALAFVNGLAGSAIVALALIHRHIDGEKAFRAIRVEEDWQAERWGRDPDEEKIANARRVDLIAAERLVSALA
ncbi:ATP12 family chaperone protein [Aquidulcibacter sp.]|jgi:chaperone required for assembly of F1-ATPase|uniref:ATP12 family chaperone protein n=1 Tax=Aquidulcibacter sp. TaxID=2052990 RepID=UPI0028B0A411|nr:ATP12 family protein [Aquidulcibacter sp.]